MQPVIPQYVGVLVDVVDGELDGWHDAPADYALGHVGRVGEEAGDVHVAPLDAAEVKRLLARARQDGVEQQQQQH